MRRRSYEKIYGNQWHQWQKPQSQQKIKSKHKIHPNHIVSHIKIDTKPQVNPPDIEEKETSKQCLVRV